MAINARFATFTVCLLGASAPAGLFGQELITNGNFESPQLAPWEITTVEGSSAGVFPENSPFAYPYGSGSESLRLTDDDADFLAPSVTQSFAAVASAFFSFDFKVQAGSAGSPWYVAWEGEDQTTAFFFSLGGGDGASLELNQTRIGPLRGNAWYHVQGWADPVSETVEGFFINDRGERADFQSGFPFGVKDHLQAVTVSDGAADPNQPVLLDNFSTRLVSLESRLNPQGRQVITWGGSTNFLLQVSATLGPGAQWTTVPAANGSYTNDFSGKAGFFRLIRP